MSKVRVRLRGFILQASYRVVSRPGEGRVPVIHLYGRIEDGRTFLVREHRRRPHFYIRTADLVRARECRAPEPTPTARRSFDGSPVSRIELRTPQDVPELRERLHAAGVDTFEADVRFAPRYLMELGIKGGCEIEGEVWAGPGSKGETGLEPEAEPRAGVGAEAEAEAEVATQARAGSGSGSGSGAGSGSGSGAGSGIEAAIASGSGRGAWAGSGSASERGANTIHLVFDDPVLTPADVRIEPQVLSFDIETDSRGERLLAISMFGPGIDEVLIVDGSGRDMPAHAICCVNEYAALDAFCEHVRRLDPDVLTGWNIIDFDLTALQRMAVRLGHPFQLGREGGAIRIRKAEGYFGSGQASVPGRLVLDGIDLLRGAFVRMDDYSLDAVAREVLGEGKAVSGDVRDRIGEIQHNYRHDLEAFARYARTDARLAYQIVERLNVVELAFARSRLAGMTPDRVAASIASFDFMYLSELEHLGVVAPSVRSPDARAHVAQQGGHVLAPVTGLHRNVWVFDFTSLYPSIIRTFNIDPLSFAESLQETRDRPRAAAVAVKGDDRPLGEHPRQPVHRHGRSTGDTLICTGGAAFRREPAILPRLLDELFPQRENAKRSGDRVAANAIKILMNSFYGVLGTPACRFFNPAIANAITGTGREMLLWSKQWFEAAGYTVLYGDTDSLFVSSGGEDVAAALELGERLADRLSAELAQYIEGQWGVRSRLSLKFEKLYVKLFLPRARHSTRGASKRYVGMRYHPGVAVAPPAEDGYTQLSGPEGTAAALTGSCADGRDANVKCVDPANPGLATADLISAEPASSGPARSGPASTDRVSAERANAGLAHADLEFVGMEVVRRDWTALAKQVQRELYHRLFTDQAVDVYLASITRRVREGRLDDALVYRKNLRKETAEYTATTPPHVVAARKSLQPPGRLISYVMTSAGPEPLDNVQHPLDREHYVLKQIRPVAEPVLATLGFDFERVIGDQRQMDLLSMFEDG